MPRRVRVTSLIVAAALTLAFVVALYSRLRPRERLEYARKSDVALSLPSRSEAPRPPQPMALNSLGARVSDSAREFRIDVRVLDENGAAIPGAELYVSRTGETPGASDLAGSTAPDGSFEVVAPLDYGTFHLTATAERRASRRLRVAFPYPASLSIVLAASSEISGVVVGPSGKHMGAGIRVLAWRSTGSPSLEAVEQAVAEPLVAVGSSVATSDSIGRFTIERLEPGVQYVLAAGGSGHASPRLVPALSGSYDVELPVAPVFAAALRLQEGGGRPLKCKHEFLEGYAFVWTDPPGINCQPASQFVRTLLGVPGHFGGPSEPAMRVVAVVANTEAEEIGPFEVGIQVPGYRKLEAAFVAQRWSGSVFVQEIDLAPLTGPTGTLVIRYHKDLPVLLDEMPSGTLVGYFSLSALNPDADTVQLTQFPIRLTPSYSFTIEGLAMGDYAFRFQNANRLFYFPDPRDPPLMIRIGPEPAEVLIEANAVGALDCELVNGDGTPFEGMALVHLVPASRPQAAGRIDTITMSGTSLSIECVPETSYEVRVTVDAGVAEEKNAVVVQWRSLESPIVRIGRGERSHVVIDCQ